MSDTPATPIVMRVLREAEITGRLEHPGIIPVYGLGTDAAGRPYYAMRFVRGQTLKEAIGGHGFSYFGTWAIEQLPTE